jgi:hypothetical protein
MIKKIKTRIAKAAVKAKAAIKAIATEHVDRAYTAFSRISRDCYVAQGELTVAAIRACEIVESMIEYASIGKTIIWGTSTQGWYAMAGTIVDGVCYSGKFGLQMFKDTQSGTWNEFRKFILKNGDWQTGDRCGVRFICALGIGCGYGFALTDKGGIIRLEDNSNRAAQRRFGYTVQSATSTKDKARLIKLIK